MATINRIEFAEFGPYKVIGKAIRTKHENFNPIFPSEYETIPSLWNRCYSDGTFEKLINMNEYCPAETPDGYEGYIRDFNNEDGTFTYLAGFFMKADTPVPPDYSSFEVPICTIAKVWIEGEEYDILTNAHKLSIEEINKHGYEIDWKNYFACEVYTEARYGIPKREGRKTLILDYYIPCIKNT
ncbi:hypothetical protein SH1V18_28970 [Vallitalea longa]|uniref:GyrI-like small molecule binding domain-containing protein n=1 Tax=Vallitalea longa TaxID=2936439 RepID=A0A9W5YBG2_9FIRM|nr:GyrI-like domain-containing protein [Vallitalea longa]GKX30417.1 hypothetical protein SH1V18_28970 [Vallitalea longa]